MQNSSEMEDLEIQELEAVFGEICTQDQCIFRDKKFDRDFVAEVLWRVASGRDVSELVPEEQRITPRECCRRCARAVLEGQSPLRTAAELKRLIERGEWSGRRERRRSA